MLSLQLLFGSLQDKDLQMQRKITFGSCIKAEFLHPGGMSPVVAYFRHSITV